MSQNNMAVCAIIQARFSSTRLPGKVLYKVNGRDLLSYMIERVKFAEKIDSLAVATSIEESDDPIEQLCKQEGILVFRGDLEDVLDRYYNAAIQFDADVIVRLTGDCPLIDPRVIDMVVDVYQNNHYDYVGNTVPPKGSTFPDGMDVEVFSFEALERAWNEAKKPSDREHVTFYFWENPHLFSTFRYDFKKDLSKYRLTVDYLDDFKVVASVISELYPNNNRFTMEDVLAFLDDNPDIWKKNKFIQSNLGWQNSFEKDREMGF